MNRGFWVVILFLASLTVFSQQDNTLFPMRNVPQTFKNNPSFIPTHKVNIGLPAISSLYFNFSNNGFTWSQVVRPREDDSLVIDINDLIKSLRKRNLLSTSAHIDLFSFGININEQYFRFSITEKVNGRFIYPKGFAQLAWEGNGKSLLGERANLDKLGLDFMHYREFNFGYARPLTDKINVGGSLKFLKGFGNVYTKKSQLGLTTNEETFDLTLDGQFQLYSSGFAALMDDDSTTEFTAGNYLTGANNNGVAFDIGGNYQLTDKINVSAAINDIGFIRWKRYIQNFRNDDINFKFTGIDIKQFFNASDSAFDEFVEKMEDSIQNTLSIDESSGNYSTPLHSSLILGGSYNLNEHFTVGAMSRTSFVKSRLQEDIAVSLTTRVKKWFEATINTSVYSRQFNIGTGFAINGGPLQLYVLTDNVLAPLIPHKTRTAHIRAGINLTFRKREKDSDKDKIVDKDDECPDVAGLAEYKGCPDTDGDGIIDKNDECPEIPGPEEYHGCPDTDGDGISDKSDQCPEVPGPLQHHGCPDTDDDGTVDKDDACPEIPGPANNKGCPLIPKVHIVDSMGAAPIASTEISADGIFYFENLKSDQSYLFRMDDSNSLENEIFIGISNKDVIKAKKHIENYYLYKYTPPSSSLHLLSMNDSSSIKTTEPDSNNLYSFSGISGNNSHLFKLDNADTSLQNIQILLEDEDTIISATNTTDNFYEYQAEVKLKEEEKKVLDAAIGNLEFETGKATIVPTSIPFLKDLSKLLHEYPDAKIIISGHTDDVGKAEDNLKLSKERAEAVKTVLADNSVSQNRIIVQYYGETKPIAENTTPDGRQKNRRVEMKILQ